MVNNETNVERLHYVDIIKGIGIILVVLGHTYRGNVVQNWLYSFHMPLFFFISGWLLNIEKIIQINIRSFVVKKVRSLLLPYVLFYILTYLYWLLIERHFRTFNQGPLWFLISLFVAEIATRLIAPVLVKIKFKATGTLIVLILLLIIIGKLGNESEGTLGWIIRLSNGTIWYLEGWCFAALFRKRIVECQYTRKLWGTICCIFMPVSIWLGCSNGRVDMYINRFNNIFLYVLSAFTGIILCVAVSRLINKNKLLEYLGRYSIIILCTHEPIKRAVIKISSIIVQGDSEIIRNNILFGVAIAAAVIFIEIFVIAVFKWLGNITHGTKFHMLFDYVK